MKAEARSRRNRTHRACWEGSWEGGGVLLALETASCLVEDTACQRDGKVIVVASFLVAGGVNFQPVGVPNSQFLRRSHTRK